MSKKQENGIIESKVELYSIKASSHIFICQLNVNYGQDSVFGIVPISVLFINYFRWLMLECNVKNPEHF
jgi:hypothetical protein